MNFQLRLSKWNIEKKKYMEILAYHLPDDCQLLKCNHVISAVIDKKLFNGPVSLSRLHSCTLETEDT